MHTRKFGGQWNLHNYCHMHDCDGQLGMHAVWLNCKVSIKQEFLQSDSMQGNNLSNLTICNNKQATDYSQQLTSK